MRVDHFYSLESWEVAWGDSTRVQLDIFNLYWQLTFAVE